MLDKCNEQGNEASFPVFVKYRKLPVCILSTLVTHPAAGAKSCISQNKEDTGIPHGFGLYVTRSGK